MINPKNKFTFKIILSYLILGALSIVIGFFIYSEYNRFTTENSEVFSEQKYVETGTLINLVYETDGFSRLALLTESDSDFDKFNAKTQLLFKKIEDLKDLTNNAFQRKQLDSIKMLLAEKNQNIEQLRILRLTNSEDTSLDDILSEVKKLENTLGKNSVETLHKDPSSLTRRERRIYEAYADYLNSNRNIEASDPKKVDSILSASRFIVSEAKRANSAIRSSLKEKENELINNDLKISARLRGIISSFDREIAKNVNSDKLQKDESLKRTSNILRIGGIIGAIFILVFTYIILTDFFKAEKFKRNLEKEKNYSEALLKSREQLISTVSHDLKTPLNTISGYSELFEKSNLSQKQKNYLKQIISSSHFIGHLVDDLLDFSKLEAGKLPLEKLPFSLENIINQSGQAIKDQYLEKPVQLKIEIAETVKNVFYESDPFRIQQIINNLVGNAFKFTASGSVAIQVNQLKAANDLKTIEIKVIDTGIGISEEKQDIIFAEFTQAESDTAHKFGGSGLGLAISKKLATLLNGTLTVASQLGQGSIFTLTLPLQIAKGDFVEKEIKSTAKIKDLKALVLDDDQAMLTMLTETLQQLNISCIGYTDFKHIEGSDVSSVDFVLTDVQMPETDGFEVLKKVNSGALRLNEIPPVIAMTGSREHPHDFFLKTGFAEMLPKPFGREELIHIVEKLFPNKVKITHNGSSSTKESVDTEHYSLKLISSFVNTPAAINQVLDVFYEQTKTDMEDLKMYINTKNLEGIKNITHRMLSMFRQLLAKNCVPLLEDMEIKNYNSLQNDELQQDYNELNLNVEELLAAMKNNRL